MTWSVMQNVWEVLSKGMLRNCLQQTQLQLARQYAFYPFVVLSVEQALDTIAAFQTKHLDIQTRNIKINIIISRNQNGI
mgnify:CR=1 FL=1